MFYDEAKIYIRSGDGGNGMISFRREKYVPFGGPDGGDGGDGGAIIFKVNKRHNSLAYFHRKVHFKAPHGVAGGRMNKTGARGQSLILEVPPGTILREVETGRLLGDLTEPDQELVLLKGGAGGKGNSRFSSSTNQAPKIAERGEKGHELWITMELKLIADIGLVGKPNAGKSTLLSRVSNAAPKVANYPFTTLNPSLGVIDMGEYETMVMADIPGLIEGAAEGVGLGHDFLRHIERTRVLVHLLDGAAFEPLEDFKVINQELIRYQAGLEDKPQLVVLNKLDLADAQAWEPLIEEEIIAMGFEFMAVSAVSGENLKPMLHRLQQLLAELPEPEPLVKDEMVVIRAEADEDHFEIEKIGPNEWMVSGDRIEYVASRTYFDIDSTALRFQRVLDSMGINKALQKAGVQDGDSVWFGDIELEWQAE